MKQDKTTRKSQCRVCGKRLSEKTVAGTIRWQPGHIDDSGLYCESCYESMKGGKGGKSGKNGRA